MGRTSTEKGFLCKKNHTDILLAITQKAAAKILFHILCFYMVLVGSI